jgi:hypothetical protein
MEPIPQERLILSDCGQLGDHPTVEFVGVPRPEVAQSLPFPPTPQDLDRVESRSVRGQPLAAQTSGEVVDPITDRVPFVHGAAVPDDHESPGQSSQHRLPEGGPGPALEGAVGQGSGVQAQPIPPWRQPKGGRDRDLLACGPLLRQVGRLATRCPGPAGQGSPQQTGLVDPGAGGTLPPGLFLRRGQSDSSPAALAFGSRWRGTRCGFCGVNPRARRQALRDFGWSSTATSSRIRRPQRGAVRSSVSHPCAVGLSSRRRRRIFSWVEVSFRGRPGTGRAMSPCSPRSRTAAPQRRTVEGSPPRKSAPSSVESPSQTRCTARRRRCSNSFGVPYAG